MLQKPPQKEWQKLLYNKEGAKSSVFKSFSFDVRIDSFLQPEQYIHIVSKTLSGSSVQFSVTFFFSCFSNRLDPSLSVLKLHSCGAKVEKSSRAVFLRPLPLWQMRSLYF